MVPRCSVGVIGLDEVRDARDRSALAYLSGSDTQAASVVDLRGGLRRRDSRGILRALARRSSDRRGSDVLRAHAEDAGYAPVALLALGLGAISRARHPRLARPSKSARRPAGRGCDRCRIRAGEEDAAATRRADRCAADRLRARPDALVLSLHPLVLPL